MLLQNSVLLFDVFKTFLDGCKTSNAYQIFPNTELILGQSAGTAAYTDGISTVE